VDRGGPGSATSEACAIKLSVSTPEILAQDVARAIRTLASNNGLRLRLGAAAHAHVTGTALWSAKLDRMDVLYADILSHAAKTGAMPGSAQLARITA
jgi:hypothetical protein